MRFLNNAASLCGTEYTRIVILPPKGAYYICQLILSLLWYNLYITYSLCGEMFCLDTGILQIVENFSHERQVSYCYIWLIPWLLIIIWIYMNKVDTLRPRQNGRHFADDISNGIFLNENVWIPLKFSLKFVPKGPINNIPALVQIMAWCGPGDKPLSEPKLVSLVTHICVTRPQWVS